MPQIALQSSDAVRALDTGETRLAASPITSRLTDNGVLQLLCGHEGRSAPLNATFDPLAALQHVVEMKPVILQSGAASRRILSRTYQCSDLSVPA